ncbi:MAG: IPT/TIG domain-containing protein, partial [Candidatus Sumerlaeia bacterium]|nr:IPT/TIG domain-containing protein [Candidatus Sumerlaeia bacterium]
MRHAGRLVLFAAFVFLCGPVAAMVFDDLVPAAGPAGTSVRLVAREPLTGSHTVRLGESGAPVATTPQGNELLFAIPPGAATGELFVSHDGGDFETTGFVFRVARTVQVRVQVPDAALFAGHDVGSNIDDGVVNAIGWLLPVSQGETALVAATAEAADAPQLLGVATDSMSEVVLSGLSTATTMIFLAPGVFTADPVEADARLTAIAGLDGVVAAAAIAEGHLAAGRDFLSDARYEDALADALIEYSTLLIDEIDGQLETAAKFVEDTVTDNHGFATGSPRDIVGAVNVLRIKAMDPTTNADNIPVNRFGYEGRPLGVLGKKINPLDWIAHAWALDPEQFTGGIPAIHALTAADVETRRYDRLSATPVSSLSVKATNVLKNLNLIDVASDLLLGFAPSFPPDDGLEFPSDRHGVYMVRAYSGAVYPNLDSLIGLLPEAGDEDAFMKGINVVLAAIEFASILLPVQSVLGSEVLAKVVYRAAREAMAAAVREGKESGAISAEFLLTVFLEVSKGIVKQLLSVAADQGLKAIPRLGKSIAKFFNVLGKAASVGASAERLAALTNASRLLSDRAFFAPSVESTVVVVGDPFAPEVLEVSPLRAHRGRVVRLTGRRFIANQPGAHIVQFGSAGTDPYATTGAGEVLFASEDTLLVVVPEEASSGPITVAIVDRGVANSVRIAEGQGFFEVIPDPVLTAVEPSTVLPGGTIRIVGTNFSPRRGENRVTFTGSGLGANLLVLDHWEEGLLIQAPSDLVSGTVTVTVGTRSSNALPLTTVLSGTIPGGATLTVSSTADNTAADGHLTLREAILLATGQLGRSLTSPPEDRPLGATYETDFVSGTPGAGVRDTIDASFGGSEPTITLVAPLPSLGNYNVLRFSLVSEVGTVINGSSV